LTTRRIDPDADKALTDFASKILADGWPQVDIPQPGPTNLNITTDSSRKSSIANFCSDYHFHAHQALILASAGGLPGVYEAEIAGEEGKENLTEEAPPVGKSLFIALDLTTWEADEETVLDVGWAAVWWQKRLEGDEGEGKFEEMRDRGHFM
jgi:hypothetical protein